MQTIFIEGNFEAREAGVQEARELANLRSSSLAKVVKFLQKRQSQRSHYMGFLRDVHAPFRRIFIFT